MNTLSESMISVSSLLLYSISEISALKFSSLSNSFSLSSSSIKSIYCTLSLTHFEWQGVSLQAYRVDLVDVVEGVSGLLILSIDNLLFIILIRNFLFYGLFYFNQFSAYILNFLKNWFNLTNLL